MPPVAAVEEDRKFLFNEEELTAVREESKKTEEHRSPMMSPAQFNQAVTPLSPV